MFFVTVEDHLEDLVTSPGIRKSVHKRLGSCPGFPRFHYHRKASVGDFKVQGVCVCVCVCVCACVCVCVCVCVWVCVCCV